MIRVRLRRQTFLENGYPPSHTIWRDLGREPFVDVYVQYLDGLYITPAGANLPPEQVEFLDKRTN